MKKAQKTEKTVDLASVADAYASGIEIAHTAQVELNMAQWCALLEAFPERHVGAAISNALAAYLDKYLLERERTAKTV